MFVFHVICSDVNRDCAYSCIFLTVQCFFDLLFLVYLFVLLAFIVNSLLFVFFEQKTAYEMRISDWSSDVCSSDLVLCRVEPARSGDRLAQGGDQRRHRNAVARGAFGEIGGVDLQAVGHLGDDLGCRFGDHADARLGARQRPLDRQHEAELRAVVEPPGQLRVGQQWPGEGAVEGRDAHAAAAIVRLGGQAATVAGRPSICRASCAVATRRPYCPQSSATRATSSALLLARRALSKRLLSSRPVRQRSEEHTSELQSLMRNSNAVSCL